MRTPGIASLRARAVACGMVSLDAGWGLFLSQPPGMPCSFRAEEKEKI